MRATGFRVAVETAFAFVRNVIWVILRLVFRGILSSWMEDVGEKSAKTRKTGEMWLFCMPKASEALPNTGSQKSLSK